MCIVRSDFECAMHFLLKISAKLYCRTRKRVTSAFMPGLSVESKLFVVSHDARLLFSGGHWDNSLQVFHLGKGKKVNHIGRHTGNL